AGVLDHPVLDPAGRHVPAPAHDDVVGAALEEDVALVVDPAAVARGEEAVGAHAAALAQVLPRHLLAAHADLAAHAGPDRLAVPRADLDLPARHRRAPRREG